MKCFLIILDQHISKHFETLNLRNFETLKKVGFGVYGGQGGHLHCKKNSSKASYNYSASFWISNFPISLFGNPKTHQFQDFSNFGRGPSPKTNSIYFWRQYDTINKSRTVPIHSHLLSLEVSKFHKSKIKKSKRRVPNDPCDPFKQFLKILNMGLISSRKHEMSF